MTHIDLLYITLFVIILIALVKPLGTYIAYVYSGKPKKMDLMVYKICGIDETAQMDWKQYLLSMLVLNAIGFLCVYLIQRFQFYLPFNPEHFKAPSQDLSFNTAISFVTNTDWQAYAGETTMSYFTQMMALTVQNFMSAATGMAILMALIRGIAGCETHQLGNYWVDMVRGILYLYLPLSILFAVILVSQGVIQNLHPYEKIDSVIPMGPVASQVAIKQLGTNGGGFFGANSAHPFENPTPFTNFLETLAILLIPAALCYTFGKMIRQTKQGWGLLAAMFFLFLPFLAVAVFAENQGNPALSHMGITVGNMEGKEARLGITASALWATATTAASNGSVNAMLDSFTPLGGLIPLWMMHLGEVVFGGVGSGLYGMLMVVIVTVFVAGLMVGRTPEYLGKKIEPFEMKMACVAVLVMPLTVLMFTSIGVLTGPGLSGLGNPGAHGLTEILYAFTSMANNNGSAFAGLDANTPFYNILGGIAMWIGRYGIAIPVMAIAGSLACKKIVPSSSGTLETHTPMFIILLVGVTIIIGALSFFPALSLGPIVEHLMLWGEYGH